MPKIIRTLADGGIQAAHTYNVRNAYATHAEWANSLASEFDGTDEKLEARIETPDIAPFSPIIAGIAEA